METTSQTMTREEMAVAVARDVILQLGLPEGAPIMTPGIYLWYRGPGYLLPRYGDEEDLQDYVDAMQPHCEVCQIGALFLSAVRLYDNAPADLVTPCDDGASVFCSAMRNVIDPIFGKDNVDLMESAFERFSDDASGYVSKHPNPKDRAIAIMENVVANGGHFIP